MRPARVIVGIGDRPGSGPTLRWAAAEAIHRGRDLLVVHVGRPDPCASPDLPEAVAAAHAAGVVAAAVERVRDLAPGLRVTSDAVVGCPAAALVAAAGPHDLLVVGEHGRTGNATTVRGSTCELVARRARASVAVVRGRSEPESGPVAVGFDGSPASEPVLAAAFEAAAARRCAVTVIRAARSTAPDALTVRATTATRTRAAVAPFAEKFPEVEVDILVVNGDPAPNLVTASHDARLVVIGAGRPGAGGVGALGRVGVELLRRSACPLLVAR